LLETGVGRAILGYGVSPLYELNVILDELFDRALIRAGKLYGMEKAVH